MKEMKYPNIDAERARHGISNDSLAKKLGVSRKTIFNWMDKGNIPTSSLIQMAEIFGCSIDYLLGRSA
jgi:DNA-binding XRE family transcriptional regulator